MSEKKSLVAKFSEKVGLDETKLLTILKSTAFKVKGKEGCPTQEVTNEQMAALLVVADQYDLNPFTKEIYAFPDKNNGIVPVVGVDGWSRIINSHSELDGIEFKYSENKIKLSNAKECSEWMECIIHRKDRKFPTVVRESLIETYRANAIPWQTHTSRMLRHKALIQCARLAFGFAGIYDEDEAQRIVEPAPREEKIKKVDEINKLLIDDSSNNQALLETASPQVEEFEQSLGEVQH